MGTGTANAYFLFRSDWEALSNALIGSHDEPPGDDSTDDAAEDVSKSSSEHDSGSLVTESIQSFSVPVRAKRIGGVQRILKTP